VGAAAIGAAAPSAAGRAPGPVRLVDLSGRSPFPEQCGYDNLRSSVTPHSAAEPSIAVNPRNPRHLVAAWQQDRITTGGDLSNVVAVSRDGGRTWRRVLVPGLTRCTGGDDSSASDPWVTIGPDGVVYLGSDQFTLAPDPGIPHQGVVVSTSRDGGYHFDPPVVLTDVPLSESNDYPDQPSVLADPRRPGTAYATWLQLVRPGSFLQLSKTTDGGRTWSLPTVQYLAAEDIDRTTLQVLPDGTLLDFFGRQDPVDAAQGVVRFEVIRSVDQGTTWSAPVPIGVVPLASPSDPDTGTPIRVSPFFYSCTVDANGTAYVAYYDYAGGRTKVLLSRSTDGARTWRQSVVADVPAAAFLPVVVARPDVVSVAWDDLRDFRPKGPLWTRVWLATSRDGGATWAQRAVTRPFDLRRAPQTLSGLLGNSLVNPQLGYFLGDYQSAVALPRAVLLVTSVTPPLSGRDPSHVVLARVPT
jgi:hypothetical protein